MKKIELMKKYLFFLTSYQTQFKREAKYRFTELLIQNQDLFQNKALFFSVDNQKFIIHDDKPEDLDIILKISALLSFINYEKQNSEFIHNFLVLKCFSLYSSNFGKNIWLNIMMEKLNQDLFKYENIFFLTNKLVNQVSLFSMVFEIIPKLRFTTEKDLYSSFSKIILHRFEPYFQIKDLRKNLEGFPNEVIEIFEQYSNSAYQRFRDTYAYHVNFRINYHAFKIMVFRVTLVFNSTVVLKDIEKLAENSLITQIIPCNNTCILFFHLPEECSDLLYNLLSKLKNMNQIVDFVILSKKDHISKISYESNLESSIKLKAFFPYNSRRYLQKIDLRKKKGGLAQNIKQVTFRLRYDQQVTEITDNFLIFLLVFLNNMNYFPEHSTISKFMSFLKKRMQFNAFIEKLTNSEKRFDKRETLSPGIEDLALLGQFPPKLTDAPQLLEQLHHISIFCKENFPLKRKKISQSIATLLTKQILIPNIPHSIIDLYYENPEIIHLRAFTLMKSEIIEQILFFYERVRWEERKGRFTGYLYDVIIETQYFSTILKFILKNAREIFIVQFPSLYEKDPLYLFSFWNNDEKTYVKSWFDGNIENLKEDISQRKTLGRNRRLSEFIKLQEKEYSMKEVYRDLNYVNPYLIPQFYQVQKQKYTSILKEIYKNGTNLENLLNDLDLNHQKILRESLTEPFFPTNKLTGGKPSTLVMITVQTQDQKISPDSLAEQELWSGLFQPGLLDVYYIASDRFSLCVLLYRLPNVEFNNVNSAFRRMLSQITEYGNDAVKIYLVAEELRHLNPPMIFPMDQIKANYLNLRLKSTPQEYSFQTFQNNENWKALSGKYYYRPRVRENLLFTLCYNANVLVYLPDLDNYPLDYLEFIGQSPISRTFLLEEYSPKVPVTNTTEQPKAKALLSIITLNRYVNFYYETVYRLFSDRWPETDWIVSVIVNYPWTHPETPITQIIQESHAFWETFKCERWKFFFQIPVFRYRKRTCCFSVDLRLQIWNILKKKWDHLKATLSPDNLMILSRILTKNIETHKIISQKDILQILTTKRED